MKFTRTFVAIMAIAAVTACGDDDEDGDPELDISGDYEVTEFRYTADANAAMTVDLASIPPAQGGPYGITSMVVADDNSFEGSITLPTGAGPVTFDVGGDIAFTGGDDVRIDFDDATDELGLLDDFEDGTLELEGNTITILLPNVTFNFHDVNPAAPDTDAESNLRIVGTR
jgi:hypothetical protein